MSKKIVINKCFGGFGLSDKAWELLHYTGAYIDIPRDSPSLVKVVEELGPKANGECSTLKVVEIPEDIEWEIQVYDGLEHVAEKHRKWY